MVSVTVSPNPAVVNEVTTIEVLTPRASSAALEFGDGSGLAFIPATSATIKHTYGRCGTFTVTVTVTDSAGAKMSATATVVVHCQTTIEAVNPR